MLLNLNECFSEIILPTENERGYILKPIAITYLYICLLIIINEIIHIRWILECL